jgi:transposase
MNARYTLNELQIGIDVGSLNHAIAIAKEDGTILQEFEISHNNRGFDSFFQIVDKLSTKYHAKINVAMEGYNGWARPFDTLILEHGYRLYNVNNVKLARFKEIFPGSAKTDSIDARKILELFSLKKHLPIAKEVLQEIKPSDTINAKLKKLTRRRKQLVEEKKSIANRFGSDLQAQVPDLKAITTSVDNLWFLRFITLRDNIVLLSRLHKSSIDSIPYISCKNIEKIIAWQKNARFTNSIEYIGAMLYDDAKRLLELKAKIKELEVQIKALIPSSKIATLIQTIPGFAHISAGSLAGEIGTLERFDSEASLALYLGVTNLDNSSGKSKGSKRNLATNRQAKMAIITATMKHAQHIEESKKYIEKKISEGKKYQQAIRSLARHLVRVIWNMLQQDRAYEIR